MNIFSGDPITSFQGEYHFLSNFYPNGDNFDIYKTVEHYYQACKAKHTIDWKMIVEAKTPGEAKKLGRMVEMQDSWENEKVSIMYFAVTTKFMDKELRRMLVETGDRELIEGNTWGDTFWGVCDGKGENMLGKILMFVRQGINYGFF